jgi:hypothetical protein
VSTIARGDAGWDPRHLPTLYRHLRVHGRETSSELSLTRMRLARTQIPSRKHESMKSRKRNEIRLAERSQGCFVVFVLSWFRDLAFSWSSARGAAPRAGIIAGADKRQSDPKSPVLFLFYLTDSRGDDRILLRVGQRTHPCRRPERQRAGHRRRVYQEGGYSDDRWQLHPDRGRDSCRENWRVPIGN